MNNYNRNNTPQNFNFNNNNMRGFPGNNAPFMGQNNWSPTNDFNAICGLINNLSGMPNLMPPFMNSGGRGIGRDTTMRRSNSRYSPPRSHNPRRDPPNRLAVREAPRSRVGWSDIRRDKLGSTPQRTPIRPGTTQKAKSQSQPQSQNKKSTNLKRPATTSADPNKAVDAKKAKPSPSKPKPPLDPNNPRFPMVVMPVDYPSRALSQEELIELETAITDEIAKGWDIEPEFSGTYFKVGRLHITCVNEATSKWLVERVPHLENWKGVALKVCSKDALPKVNTITVSFPKSAGQDVDKTLALVTAQNKDINTSSWKIINHKDENKSQVLTIDIDTESLEAIRKKENFLNYRFGRVSLQSIKQQLIIAESKGKEEQKQATIKVEPKTPAKRTDIQKVKKEQDEEKVQNDQTVSTSEAEQNVEEDEEDGAEEYDEGEGEEDDYDNEQEL